MWSWNRNKLYWFVTLYGFIDIGFMFLFPTKKGIRKKCLKWSKPFQTIWSTYLPFSQYLAILQYSFASKNIK